MSKSHTAHIWWYPHALWSGTHGATYAARYCQCGAIQVGRVTEWREASEKREPDLVRYCDGEMMPKRSARREARPTQRWEL